MYKSITLFTALVTAAALLSGCATHRWTAGDTGAVIGGAATAAVAHEVAEGSSNQAIYTAAGAILGAIVGRKVADNMSGHDRRMFARTLSTNRAGRTNTWTNSATNNRYSVTPTSGTYTASNRRCRQFKMKTYVNGHTNYATGTACQRPDGTWVVQ